MRNTAFLIFVLLWPLPDVAVADDIQSVSLVEATAVVTDGLAFGVTKMLADAGNPHFQHVISTAYRLGTHGHVDNKLALHWLTRAVQKKHPPALAEMGYHYRHGTLDFEIDLAKALKHFELAAELDNGYALAMIGRGYLYGELGLSKDAKTAFGYLERSVERGANAGLLDLGQMYEKGVGTDIDLHQARHFYEQAALQGNAGAQHHLATLYWEHFEDQKQAVYWYEHSVAQNFPLSYYKLGEIHRRGDEKLRNLTKALGLYMRGADLDEPYSMTMLGYLYNNGIIVLKNEKKGHEYLLSAANLGHSDAKTRLGDLYLSNPSDAWKDETGLDWVLDAAIAGNSDAQDYLEHLYLQQPDLLKTIPTALAKITAAANLGYVHGQMILGYKHYNEPNFEKAQYWFQRAASADDADSQYVLFYMNYNGLGIAVNDKAARKWLMLAVDNGSPQAMYGLARAYHYGNPRFDIEKNVVRAYELFRKSHEMGHTRAANELAWFMATSPDQTMRDGTRAVKIMEAALSQMPRNDGWVDTLAAAYAEIGDFDQAIKYQEEAIQLAEDTTKPNDIPANLHERLKAYQEKRPWRDDSLSNTVGTN